MLESFSSSVFTSIAKTADEIGRTGNESFIYELIKQSSSEITSGSTTAIFLVIILFQKLDCLSRLLSNSHTTF